MEKNVKIGTFFYKEQKRMQRSEHSFIMNGKESKDRNVLLLRKEKNAKIRTFFYKEGKRTQRLERSFEKNRCPTLVLSLILKHL